MSQLLTIMSICVRDSTPAHMPAPKAAKATGCTQQALLGAYALLKVTRKHLDQISTLHPGKLLPPASDGGSLHLV